MKHAQWVPIRDMIGRKMYFSLSKDWTHVMYSTGRYLKGDRGKIQMSGVAINDFNRCARFAIETAQQIMAQMPDPKMPADGSGGEGPSDFGPAER